MFLVDPEFLGWEIFAERFEQLASVINFRVCGGKIRREMKNFCRKGMFYKILLMAKNRDRYTLSLRKLLAHNSSYYCL